MDWRVVLFDLTIDDAEIEAVTHVLQSRWLAMGQVTKEFEQEFAAALGTSEAVAVSSGTAALHLAALALDLGPGAEVIVPSLSFVAVASTIAMTGAKPVFADIQGIDDLTIAPDEIVRLITPNTRALVVMHYGGFPANIEAILAIARDHNLKVIEDAAHSPLVMTAHGMLGTLGDVGCFSLFATKNVTMGEGGMLVSPHSDIIEKARSLRSHCMTTSSWDKQQGRASAYDVNGLGFNYRPTDLEAALGRVQLQKISNDRLRRRRIAQIYKDELCDIPGLDLPFSTYYGDSAHHLFPVLLPRQSNRQTLQAELRREGIQSSVHFPPIHLFSYYRSTCKTGPGMLPLTEEVAERELSLPMHARMQDDDARLVARTLRQLLVAGA